MQTLTPTKPDVSLLQRIEIASPCPASWDQMDGDDRKRFCHQCSRHVYNFASMTSAEAEDLIRATEGRLCGRLYRREDGRVLTADCPVGLERLRGALIRRRAWIAGLALTALASAGIIRATPEDTAAAATNGSVGELQPVRTLRRWAQGSLRGGAVTMGVMAPPMAPPPTLPPVQPPAAQ